MTRRWAQGVLDVSRVLSVREEPARMRSPAGRRAPERKYSDSAYVEAPLHKHSRYRVSALGANYRRAASGTTRQLRMKEWNNCQGARGEPKGQAPRAHVLATEALVAI